VSRGARRVPDPDERRRLFRKMEWVFVYAPPVLIVLVGGFASAFLAWLVPVRGVGFWGKWSFAMGVVVGIPLFAYVIRAWWKR